MYIKQQCQQTGLNQLHSEPEVVNALHRNMDLDVVSQSWICTDKPSVLIIPSADRKYEFHFRSYNQGFWAP